MNKTEQYILDHAIVHPIHGQRYCIPTTRKRGRTQGIRLLKAARSLESKGLVSIESQRHDEYHMGHKTTYVVFVVTIQQATENN